jgi:hypothetical protein
VAPATTTAPAADRSATPATAAAPSAVHAATPVKPAAAPAAPKPTAARYPQTRPPAFVVAGAPKEPLDEMPLVDRARALDRWLSAHPTPSNARVKYWLYQNAWVVDGARMGWWHGADALRTLIAVDQRTETLWGIGGKSENIARRALTEVAARSK